MNQINARCTGTLLKQPSVVYIEPRIGRGAIGFTIKLTDNLNLLFDRRYHCTSIPSYVFVSSRSTLSRSCNC